MLLQRLYVNIDHVATVRQARRGVAPDPVAAAELCEAAGADGITAHLREDRRHVSDDDILRLAATVSGAFNFECAIAPGMIELAERLQPTACTLVPERREEVTTEGGIDLTYRVADLSGAIERLKRAGVRTSLFIDASPDAVRRAAALGVDAIELHTGPYAHGVQHGEAEPLQHLIECSAMAAGLGLAVHAGHGLSVENVRAVSAIPEIEELNIGHAIVSRALFVGLANAVQEIRAVMRSARPAASMHAERAP